MSDKEVIEFGKWLITVAGDKPNTNKAYYWNENPSQTGWAMEDLLEQWRSVTHVNEAIRIDHSKNA